MADFNAELDGYLDRLHPTAHEHIGQSLRGGSQTTEQVFGAGHVLIDRLEKRIGEAVKNFIAGLKSDPRILSCHAAPRALPGPAPGHHGWPTQGFHANHFHPEGWISSCYYVAVPQAVQDGRSGWIKFGEPDFELGLAPRRAFEPVPGRLVLFPSYMWHGTIPFSATTARTTIAFDAVPE